jgi:uncharacterized protein with FMN-binding domain
MRRAAPVLVATAGALALLANFHTNPGSVVAVGTPGAQTPTTSIQTPATTGSTGGSPSTTAATRTIDGPAIGTRYGDVQVRVTVQGTTVVDVQAIALPFDRSKSQRISDAAAPLLRQEALQAQSARIDVVSGATYTSEGYAQSLQGALDQAGR